MERTALGIWAISRLIGNGVNAPEACQKQLLDAWIASNLMGGTEGLCDHLADLIGYALEGDTP
ncbi:hypothetical protein [Achromobacter sp. AONIH1]|uniref:hypothetical protein n=1 Tax=Achromobacter sp. AONIH1 TaxID=1758194 RepID=UPI001F23C1CE|nr:hypothetical protein [Achromobacter sp. AONIH1]